jgi:hypothetical protein
MVQLMPPMLASAPPKPFFHEFQGGYTKTHTGRHLEDAVP